MTGQAAEDIPRTPYDGKPYYCKICGLGLAEFMACEQPDCVPEDVEAAQVRARKHGENRDRGFV